MFTFLSPVLAAENFNLAPKAGSGFQNLGGITLPGLVSALITLALVVAAVIFFFMLIVGGIKWILAGGDKAQTESARNQVTGALIGLVIVFAAWAIASLLGTFFGVEIFNLNIPTINGGSSGGTYI